MEKKKLEDIKINKKNTPVSTISSEPQTILPPNGEVKYFNNYQGEIKETKIDEYLKNRMINEPRIQRTPQLKTKKRIIHKSTLLTFVFFLILGVIYFGGNILQKAKIEITSKHQNISYNNKSFSSSKSLNNNSVDFEIMIVSDKKVKNFIMTEPKNVSIKAGGIVTFYNEFNQSSQKLLAGTLLLDDTGKTYKTNNIVTIPGYKFDNSKKIVPGKADVSISAFLPGEVYNGSPEDFHITSFKNTTKYNKIYAKLKKPLEGGMTGMVYTLTENDKINIKTFAESSFKNDLLGKVKAMVPPGYILYPSATNFSYEIKDNAMSKNPEAEIEIDGTLAVILLKEQSLVNNIIKVSLSEIKKEEMDEIKILDLDKLVFNFTNENQLITKDLNTVSFSLTGDIDALWVPDVEILKSKLVGVHKDNVLAVFRQDPGISSALVKIFPPWQKYIPSDISKINIILK